MAAFFFALWAAIGGIQVILFFLVGVVLLAVPITISAVITGLVCGRPPESSAVK